MLSRQRPAASIGHEATRRRCSRSGRGTPQVDAAVNGVAVNGGDLLGGELQVVEGADVLFKLGHTARPDQDGGDPRVAQGPGDGLDRGRCR